MRGREQGVLHRIQNAAHRRHGRLSHPRALGAVRLCEVPGEGAVRGPHQELHANVPERHDLSRQNRLSRRVHQRAGPAQPHGRLHGRGTQPRHLYQAGDFRAGGLALRARRPRGRASRGGHPALQRRGFQRDERRALRSDERPRRRGQPRAVPRHGLRLRIGRRPARHPAAHLRAVPRHACTPLQPREQLYRALR